MKNKGKAEPLEALNDAIIIRKQVTKALRVIAVRKVKEQMEFDKKLANTKDEFEAGKIVEESNNKVFEYDLIKKEFDIVIKCCQEITGNLRSANTIWPEYMSEFTARRVFMDKAMGACWKLLDELQYIAEEVYADKNKFSTLELKINKLFQKIKKIRQADNRFLPDLKDSPNVA